jgi:hypothetical protein
MNHMRINYQKSNSLNLFPSPVNVCILDNWHYKQIYAFVPIVKNSFSSCVEFKVVWIKILRNQYERRWGGLKLFELKIGFKVFESRWFCIEIRNNYWKYEFWISLFLKVRNSMQNQRLSKALNPNFGPKGFEPPPPPIWTDY